jgi:ABC-type dipeptide/oligopeptide/nickel transport system permease component
VTHRLGRFLARRVAQAIGILVCIVVINFLLVHLAPGDAVDVLAGESGAADPGYVAGLRGSLVSTTRSIIQLGRYLWNLARLDMGYCSGTTRQSSSDRAAPRADPAPDGDEPEPRVRGRPVLGVTAAQRCARSPTR